MARNARRRRISTLLMASLMSGTVVSMALVVKTSAAGFTDIQSNDGNTFNTASVDLTDDTSPASTPLFHTTTRSDGYLNGAQSITRCINVKYTGTTTGTVKMYVTNPGGTQTLAQYLDIKVDQGTGATGGATSSCTNFVADGNGVDGAIAGGTAGASAAGGNISPASATLSSIYTVGAGGRLSYATGMGAWAAPVNNTTGTNKSYKVTVTVQNTNNAKGLTASANLNWEVQ